MEDKIYQPNLQACLCIDIGLIRSKKAWTLGFIYLILTCMFTQSCNSSKENKENSRDKIHLIVLAPGHFHAALLQKSMYPQIDSMVSVYAPEGAEVKAYLDLIDEYNSRKDNPTHWKERVYTGSDYLEKMIQEKQEQNAVVVIAGNNKKKTDYITKSIDTDLNVLADKPMAINLIGFDQLKADFALAKKKNVLLYDIMTERYAMTNILQKMFSHLPGVFGELEKGTREDPAIVFKSVHHFYKEVSGRPLIRPVWYFDVDQQGEGIVDVTTHLIDLIQWECFSQTVFDYKKDVQMLSARHWPTRLSLAQFSKVTGTDSFPSFLQKDIKGNQLYVFSNGEMNYELRGIHTQVSVEWKYAAPEGSGDTYFSMLRGTKANLVIRQDKEQNYKPTLYIEPLKKDDHNWEAALQKGMNKIHQQYPGISLEKRDTRFEVVIPEKYKTGHEQRFSSVVKKYLQYLKDGNMPEWEISSMLTKYYTTTLALEKALNQ